MIDQPVFRVEHRKAGQAVVLGRLSDPLPHHTALDPFVSRLLLDGFDGEVALVDERTGAVVRRRQVRPFGVKPRDRFRQLGDVGRRRPERVG